MDCVKYGTEYEFVSKIDREKSKEHQSVFILQPLSATESADMQDGAVETTMGKGDAMKMHIRSGTQVLDALRKGLKGWRNFPSGPEPDLEFKFDKRGRPDESNFNFIPASVRQEIANELIEGAKLKEEQEKN